MKKIIKRILIIQLRPFGDVLLATAGTEYLKAYYPGVRIDFLTTSPFNTLLEEHPYIDNILTIANVRGWKKFIRLDAWKLVRSGRYDLIMDYQSGTETRLLQYLSGARYRASWTDRKWSFILNRGIECPKNVYAAIRNLAMLRPLGIEEETCTLYLTPSRQGIEKQKSYFAQHIPEGHRIITVAPGSKDLRKQWHLEGYIQLVKLLSLQKKIHILLIYAPDEKQDALAVYEATKNGPVSLYTPDGNIRNVAALLEKVHLLICNELALNHITCATNTPTLCLFGPTDPATWSPQGYFPHHYHIKKADHGEDKDFGYSADEVYEKVCEILTCQQENRV